MGVDKIIKLVGVLVAVGAALMGGFPYSDLVVVLLGVAGGYFIVEDDRSRFLIAVVALALVQGSLGAIPAVGGFLTMALGGLSSLFNAAAAAVIVLGTIERLKP